MQNKFRLLILAAIYERGTGLSKEAHLRKHRNVPRKCFGFDGHGKP